MTKLEQKLIELGYKYNILNKVWFKKFKPSVWIYLYDESYYIPNYVSCCKTIDEQQDIDNLQQAFNTMQKDLEILKECEE